MDRILIALLTDSTRTALQREADIATEMQSRIQDLLRNWGNQNI